MDVIKKPLADQWTSYSGDMSGKRFSQLKHVNTNTVKNLSLKWMTPLTTGCGPTGRATAPAGGGGFGGGRGFGGGGPLAPINVGGLGNGDANNCGPARLGGGILAVDGVIYASSPSNVYAIDARDGTVLWHYYWKTRGGTSLQTRGLGMWRNYIYFELNDDWVVCLDAKTGKEIWKHEIAPFEQQYFSSNAPMVIKDHVLVGTGNDLDAPAFLKSLDPRTGAVQWILYSTPQNPGDPGLDTERSRARPDRGVRFGRSNSPLIHDESLRAGGSFLLRVAAPILFAAVAAAGVPGCKRVRDTDCDGWNIPIEIGIGAALGAGAASAVDVALLAYGTRSPGEARSAIAAGIQPTRGGLTIGVSGSF